jgi:hypothetical protein
MHTQYISPGFFDDIICYQLHLDITEYFILYATYYQTNMKFRKLQVLILSDLLYLWKIVFRNIGEFSDNYSTGRVYFSYMNVLHFVIM